MRRNQSKTGATQFMQTKDICWKNVPATHLAQDPELRLAWDQLNAARGDLPFLASDVMVIAINALGDGGERLLIGRSGARVVAMFLLTPMDRFRWCTFQPSQLPLGAWVADADLPLPDVARSLVRGPLGLCLALSITQVDPRAAPRAEDGADNRHTDYIDTGWVDIEGSFEDYWSARGKNLRQNMRKQRNRLAADGVSLTMQVLREHADMAAVIARYGSLESAGWKEQSGTAIHPDNAQGRFYRELLEHASLCGEAVVYQYRFNDHVVAMNLCLLRGGVLVVLKTTYDESIRAFLPAFLLRENELQQIFREGEIRRIEYFGRLMDWHTKLTDKKRTLYHLTVYRWPTIKKLAQARREKLHAKEPAAMGDAAPENAG